MNNEALRRSSSPLQLLTPFYPAASFPTSSQKEGTTAPLILVTSRADEINFLGGRALIATHYDSPPSYEDYQRTKSSAVGNVVNPTHLVPVYHHVASDADALMAGWEVLTHMNSSQPAYQAPSGPIFITANNPFYYTDCTLVNGESSGMNFPRDNASITTLPYFPSAPFETAKSTASVAYSVVNTSKRTTIFDRVASDLDARFSKSDLKLKAERAAGDLLNAMAPDSKEDVAAAVSRFETSMQGISSAMDKFRTSTLYPGIKKGIAVSFQTMTAAKFAGVGSSVTSASIGRIKAILALADQTTSTHPDSTATSASRTIANQTLAIFQAHLFANLTIQAEQMIKDLLAAADPESRTTIAMASKIFETKMKNIFIQREDLKDHDLYKDFAININNSLNRGANIVYSADVNRGNMADWKTKSIKLAKETGAVADETYPKDIYTPQEMVYDQLSWMIEKDFSNQIKASVKEIFPKRYEFIVTSDIGETKGIDNITKFSIERLKEGFRKKCMAMDDQQIAKHIQKNRTDLASLLMAGDRRQYTVHSGLNSAAIAVNKYLENNETELDLAIGGMFLDHIKNMEQCKLMIYS